MKIEKNKITTTVEKKTKVSEGSEMAAFLLADIHN